jgi:hypothetical protein
MSAKTVLNLAGFSLFQVDPKRHNCPASCASTANAVNRDSDLFNGWSNLLKDLLN